MKRTKTVPAPLREEAWQARDDLRTLTAASEIQSDKGRLHKAKAEAQRQMSTLNRVAQPQPKASRATPRGGSRAQRLKGKPI